VKTKKEGRNKLNIEGGKKEVWSWAFRHGETRRKKHGLEENVYQPQSPWTF